MKRLAILVFIPLIAATIYRPPSCRAQAPADSLWLKAVALAGMNNNLAPGSIRMRMQEMDKHGQPKDEDKYYETWSRLFLGEDGKVDFETIKVLENGEDITAEEKAKERQRDDEEDGKSHSVRGYDPFDADSQSKMKAVRLDTTDIIDGRATVLYEFTEHSQDDKIMTGRAWLDAAGGVPVRIEYTSDPLPKRVKRMITTLEYEYMPPESLIVRRMGVDATGGFLFIKKHFHMDMTFSEYWRLPEGYGDGD